MLPYCKQDMNICDILLKNLFDMQTDFPELTYLKNQQYEMVFFPG